MTINSLKVINRYFKQLFVLFLFVYLIFLINFFFNLTDLNLNCLTEPITQDDYILHYAQSIDYSKIFKSNYSIWGYNPNHFAGYPGGLDLAVSNHLALLFQILLGDILNPTFVFNLSIFLVYFTLPFFSFFAAKNFKLGRLNTMFFFIMSILFIMGFGLTQLFSGAGMYSFLLTIFMSIYVSSLFFRYLFDKKKHILINLTIFGSLSFLFHPFSAIICGVLCVPFILFYHNKIKLYDLFKILLCLAIIFFVNLIWILPIFKFADIFEGFGPHFQTPISQTLNTLRQGIIVLPLILIFFFFYTLKNKEPRFAKSILSSYMILFMISFFGYQIGLRNIEPFRFLPVLILLSLLGVSKIFEEKLKEKNVLFLLCLLFFVILLISNIKPFRTLTCGYKDSTAHAILDFIKDNTSKNARIHVQDSRRHHPYFNSHFTSIIPQETSREILAGPYTHHRTKFQFTQFIGNRIFEKRLENIQPSQFEEYLNLYNIKYFLVFSRTAKKFFDHKKKFKKIFAKKKFAIYDYMESTENFCYKCNADIKAHFNQIVVQNARSEKIILKYHYIKTLKIIPEYLKIKPIYLLDDPIPFIMVENKGNDFIIYN